MPPTTTIDDAIDSAELATWLDTDRDCRLIDVRSPAEFEAAHIPGSYNVPLGALDEHAAELSRNLDVPVVLVCRSGTRAGNAGRTLAAAGMAQVHVLDGGMQRWDDGQRPVRRGASRWDLERQVRLVAGSLVLAGIVGSTKAPRLKYLSGAIGAGLTFAAVSNTCTMGALLSRLPYNQGATCDIDQVVRELTTAEATAA
ncbi:rhodanese-like domain-containing protein [Iamia majanohamensis]|uniref:Rhodanese-like domain-containing protein n=1 Tax=Iamia majanohamensis TaxID=467976 RepID=A0AAE9Y4R6_9ACTN|nr:rhodanese-like domain-containing protein [Iamia majanohamensis]WCO66327.1 rhodanese-like domain-containing protein [Iamia majanohamensis]